MAARLTSLRKVCVARQAVATAFENQVSSTGPENAKDRIINSTYVYGLAHQGAPRLQAWDILQRCDARLPVRMYGV